MGASPAPPPLLAGHACRTRGAAATAPTSPIWKGRGVKPGVGVSRYAAFISYNHRDRRTARWLHRALETYRFPRRLRGRDSALGPIADRLPPVFQDREELASSFSLAESVRLALEQAASLIVICSPDAARSRWVNEEIRAFTALGRRDRIQCLIADGEPNASRLPGRDPARECLPPALFEQGGEEPLAADIRPAQDGRATARLKLLAGILAIPFDELRRREQARRQRRLLALAAAASISFLLMAALTVFAFLSRREALEQRDLARQKTVTAERTSDFVQSLFEVSDPSEARGARISALEVLDKGADRIRTSLNDEPNVKAQLMTTLSSVYLGLGSYRRGEAIIRQSARLRVTDPAVRARQAMTLAFSAYQQGEYEPAVRRYREALAIVERDPERTADLKPAVLAALGAASSRAGDTAGGDAGMLEALRLDRARFGDRGLPVARDLEALGVHEQALGHHAAARRRYEQALGIRLAAQGATHPIVSDDLNELGYNAYMQGDGDAAETYWRRALRTDMVVLGPDHPDVASTLGSIARVELERRKFREARAALRRAVAITVRHSSGADATLAFLYANLGIAERELGRPAAAADALGRALTVAEATGSRNLAPILTEQASLACAGGRAAAGLALLDRAAPITRRTYPKDAWRSAWVDNTRGACLIAAGRPSEAIPLLRASVAAIRARWPRSTLYRDRAEQRLAAAAR